MTKNPLALVLALLACGGIGFAAGYFWAPSDATVVLEVEAQNAALRDTLATRDSLRAVLDDSLTALRGKAAAADSAARAAKDAWRGARALASRTGDTLEKHLEARQDEIGLALLREHEDADLHRERSAAATILAQGDRINALLAQGAVKDRIIAQQDSSLASLKARLTATEAELIAEIETLNKQLHPPFALTLLRKAPEFLLGVAGGYALAKL